MYKKLVFLLAILFYTNLLHSQDDLYSGKMKRSAGPYSQVDNFGVPPEIDLFEIGVKDEYERHNFIEKLNTGQIIVGGSYSKEYLFDEDTIFTSRYTEDRPLLFALDEEYNLEWVLDHELSPYGSASIMQATSDSLGNIYCLGKLNGDFLKFGDQTIDSSGYFLLKISSKGEVLSNFSIPDEYPSRIGVNDIEWTTKGLFIYGFTDLAKFSNDLKINWHLTLSDNCRLTELSELNENQLLIGVTSAERGLVITNGEEVTEIQSDNSILVLRIGDSGEIVNYQKIDDIQQGYARYAEIYDFRSVNDTIVSVLYNASPYIKNEGQIAWLNEELTLEETFSFSCENCTFQSHSMNNDTLFVASWFDFKRYKISGLQKKITPLDSVTFETHILIQNDKLIGDDIIVFKTGDIGIWGIDNNEFNSKKKLYNRIRKTWINRIESDQYNNIYVETSTLDNWDSTKLGLHITKYDQDLNLIWKRKITESSTRSWDDNSMRMFRNEDILYVYFFCQDSVINFHGNTITIPESESKTFVLLKINLDGELNDYKIINANNLYSIVSGPNEELNYIFATSDTIGFDNKVYGGSEASPIILRQGKNGDTIFINQVLKEEIFVKFEYCRFEIDNSNRLWAGFVHQTDFFAFGMDDTISHSDYGWDYTICVFDKEGKCSLSSTIASSGNPYFGLDEIVFNQNGDADLFLTPMISGVEILDSLYGDIKGGSYTENGRGTYKISLNKNLEEKEVKYLIKDEGNETDRICAFEETSDTYFILKHAANKTTIGSHVMEDEIGRRFPLYAVELHKENDSLSWLQAFNFRQHGLYGLQVSYLISSTVSPNGTLFVSYTPLTNSCLYNGDTITLGNNLILRLHVKGSIQSNNDFKLSKGEPRINIYPNPVSDYLNWRSGKDSFDKIEIKTIAGQVVFCETNMANSTNNGRINVRNLPPGVFLLKASKGNQSILKKFVRL